MRKMKIPNMGQIQTEHNRFRMTQSLANNRQPFLLSPNERKGLGYEMFRGRGSSAAKLPWPERGETKRRRSNRSISLVACIRVWFPEEDIVFFLLIYTHFSKRTQSVSSHAGVLGWGEWEICDYGNRECERQCFCFATKWCFITICVLYYHS